MIVVHHLNNSRSQRVLWLLEELGVPYEIRRYQRDARTMLAPLLLKLVFDRVENGPLPFFIKPVAKAIARQVKRSFIAPQINLHLDYLEAQLAHSDWFAGDEFSAADIQLSFPLEAAALRGGLNESRPRLHGFLRRIHSRSAYRRALERGGKYDFAQ